MEIIAAFVAGLLALVGGYLGAWAARRTDYEKWLRQERSAVFSQFLQQLHETWVSSVGALSDHNLSDSQVDCHITEQFVSLESKQNIVRLYLPEKDRASFTSLVHRMWVAQSRILSQGRRMAETRDCMSAIQSVFESRLHG